MQGALAARLDALDKHTQEAAEIKSLAEHVAQLEAGAAQTMKALAAAEQQADARIRRQESELHLLQETVLELGAAVHVAEISEAAWGDSLASVQAEVEHVQQGMEDSMQRMSEALRTDLTRYADCLSQARAVLSDHAQQLGRLSVLPTQVAGLSEELVPTQQTGAQMRAELDGLAALPGQLMQLSHEVTALEVKQGAASAAAKDAASSSSKQIEGVRAELESLHAQLLVVAQQCKSTGSRLAAAEKQVEGIDQVRELSGYGA